MRGYHDALCFCSAIFGLQAWTASQPVTRAGGLGRHEENSSGRLLMLCALGASGSSAFSSCPRRTLRSFQVGGLNNPCGSALAPRAYSTVSKKNALRASLPLSPSSHTGPHSQMTPTVPPAPISTIFHTNVSRPPSSLRPPFCGVGSGVGNGHNGAAFFVLTLSTTLNSRVVAQPWCLLVARHNSPATSLLSMACDLLFVDRRTFFFFSERKQTTHWAC